MGLGATKEGATPHPVRSIHMWEQVHRLGRTFYVPLDEGLQPLADLALEDTAADDSYAIAQTLAVASAAAPAFGWDAGLEEMVVRFVERLLERGDATTYELYEALVLRLHETRLLDQRASVDLLRILAQNFYHYEFPGDRGVMLRRWTLEAPEDEQRPQAPTGLMEQWGDFVRDSRN